MAAAAVVARAQPLRAPAPSVAPRRPARPAPGARDGGSMRRRRLRAAAAAGAAGAGDGDHHVAPWRRVVAVAAGALLLCNLHRSAFAVLLPDLCAQLGLRAGEAGAVQAVMLAGYLAGQLPAGRLADEYGGPRVLLAGLALWSAATALTAAAGLGVGGAGAGGGAGGSGAPLRVILASRALMGLASACAMPCVTATAVAWVPRAERSAAVAFVYANFNVGGVIGLALTPLLADAVGGGAAFALVGAAGVAWAAGGALAMRRLTRGSAGGAGEQQQPEQQRGQQQQQQLEQQQQSKQRGAARSRLSWRLDAASQRQVALLCFAHAVIGAGFFLLQNFLPSYVRSLGGGGESAALAGRLSAAPWLAAAVVGMLAGSVSDGLIRGGLPTLFVRRLMQAASFGGCALSALPLALAPDPGLGTAVACLAANLACYSLSFGGFHAHLQDVAGGAAGVLQGVTNSASILAGIACSLLTGLAVERTGSYCAVFGALACVYAAAACVWCACTSDHVFVLASDQSPDARLLRAARALSQQGELQRAAQQAQKPSAWRRRCRAAAAPLPPTRAAAAAAGAAGARGAACGLHSAAAAGRLGGGGGGGKPGLGAAMAVVVAGAAWLGFAAPAALAEPLAREELSFIMVKPDGVQRGLIAEIIGRFERKGYKLVGIKVLVPTQALAERHYAEHAGKPFFPKLVNFLSSGPVVAMVWEGKEVVKTGRAMIGATNPLASPLGTIRGDLAIDTGRNIIHGSDSVESAAREIALWFKAEELADYTPTTCAWVYESLARCTRVAMRVAAQQPLRQGARVGGTLRDARALPRARRVSSKISCSGAAATEVAAAEGLVFGLGGPGAWDAAAVGNPVVRCYVGDNEQRWYMWYSGADRHLPGLSGVAPGSGSIGVAVSRDGIAWARGDGLVEGHRGAEQAGDVGIVLGPNPDNWWTLDTHHLAVSDVQVLSNSSVSSGVGVYWMFYSGGDFEPVPAPPGLPGAEPGAPVEGLRLRPGLAMSQDGRNWARIEADHHTGALFDVGAAGEWDAAFIGHPQVLNAGPRDMRMYYHSFDAAAGKFKVGLATSCDGFTWAKQGPVFEGGPAGAYDGGGAAACQVVRDPDSKQYLMFYEAVGPDGARSIGLATSADGKAGWRRADAPALAPAAPRGAWDAGGVGAPCGVAMSGGRWRLYYAGRAAGAGPWQGIGVALGAAEAGAGGGVTIAFKRRTGKPAQAQQPGEGSSQ
ncbi:NDK1 [Scenedesmus sp. PABB004]|nr:NDK1 [Scenedesmus sp. PABB004]